jgi:hypothetical protein
MSGPRICFGQQPCGFFPRRYLFAKIATARRLQAELGGEIVFFCHDSDHDPRETQTILRHRRGGEPAVLNFTFANRIQRRWSPLHLKRVPPGWQAATSRQLPAYVGRRETEAFQQVTAATAAGFCLEMYRRLGFLEGITVVRSSDPAVRRAACDVPDFFVDVPYEGEIVRARWSPGAFRLHQGGDAYLDLPPSAFTREQVSPARDTRLAWMQSVVRCTHYIAGLGEQAYLRRADAPDIVFLNRDEIDRPDEAYTDPS